MNINYYILKFSFHFNLCFFFHFLFMIMFFFFLLIICAYMLLCRLHSYIFVQNVNKRMSEFYY